MKKFLNYAVQIVLFLTCCTRTTVYAQHNHAAAAAATSDMSSFHLQNFSADLSDEELKGFKMQTFELDLPPGESDTVSHKHDCDVFVVVLQGTAELRQDFGDSLHVLHAGQVFHENRNVTHSLTRNPDQKIPLKLEIIFIAKSGRPTYTPLYKQ